MQQQLAQQAIIVSASSAGVQARGALLERGVLAADCTASLIALRRALVCGECLAPILFCVTLDEPTLRRHGEALRLILDDRAAFATHIGAIGLHASDRLPDGWTKVGCDTIASSIDQLVFLMERFESHATACIGGRFSQPQQQASVWLDIEAPEQDRDCPRIDDTRFTDLLPPQPRG